MTAASRARFAEVVRAPEVDATLACLLIGCESEPDLDLGAAYATLDALAESARATGALDSGAAGLALALGEQAGFGGSAGDYEDLRSSLLHEVLRRGRGLPITLSVVWCEVAARLGIDARPLNVPGHILVLVGEDVVDPFHGGAPAPVSGYDVLQPVELVARVLNNIRALTARQERSLDTTRTRLWATELSLLLPSHPAVLRREQGELMVRLGDHLGGADVLELYADVVEDAAPEEAESSRRSARQARARLN